MDAFHMPSGGFWLRAKRLGIVLGAAALFVTAASLIKPDPQGAHAAANSPTVRSTTEPAARGTLGPQAASIPTQRSDLHPKGWKLVATVEGREHTLKCWATPDGPRYSVYTPDGQLLQDELPADEVYRGFPDIPLPDLHAATPRSGLLVDFADTWRE